MWEAVAQQEGREVTYLCASRWTPRTVRSEHRSPRLLDVFTAGLQLTRVQFCATLADDDN